MDIIHEFNFSEIRPTLEQKTWMAGLIMSKVETSSSLAKKYHYSRKRLNTIVSQIREGKVLHSHGGRPRVLDEESYKNCRDEIFGREAGVISVLARGARSSRKRFGSALDLFVSGQAQVQSRPGRDLHTLAAFDVTRQRPGLGEDLGRFGAASALCECVIRVVEEESSPRLYDDLLNGLDEIATSSAAATTAQTATGYAQSHHQGFATKQKIKTNP